MHRVVLLRILILSAVIVRIVIPGLMQSAIGLGGQAVLVAYFTHRL